MKTSRPVSERIGWAKTAPSLRVRRHVHPKRAMPRARLCARGERKKERGDEQTPHGGLIKGLTGFATLASLGRMRLTSDFRRADFCSRASAPRPAQEKRSWLGRVFHPFGSSEKIPEYKNPKLRGLVLAVELPAGSGQARRSRASSRSTSSSPIAATARRTLLPERTTDRDPAPRFRRAGCHPLVR